jgi:hypothetical protein
VLRAGIVLANELPRDRSTLLVRIMVAGPGLRDAIADLAALPEQAHERSVGEDLMVHLSNVLGSRPSPTAEEEEIIVSIQGTWSDARRLGRAEEAARAVLTVLRVRGIVVPDEARERVLAQKDVERLERWLEKASVAASVEEVLGKPRRRAATKSAARPRARVEKPRRAPRKTRAS